MNDLELAFILLLAGMLLISSSIVFQMYTVLTEIYSLDRYQDSPRLGWIAAAVFFSFSLALYWFCPNARKKGIILLILGGSGLICYGLGMYFKHLAQAA